MCIRDRHLEIIQERLDREFNLNLITSAPTVVYQIKLKDNKKIQLQNPSDMPEANKIEFIEEPWILATIIVPDQYLGPIIQLCIDRRGQQVDLNYVESRVMLKFRLPLNEVVFNFYDKLKSISKGYASFDYEITGYREGNLVKMGILVNAEPVDALSMIIHKDFVHSQGRLVCEKLKE